jgi:hypothetical protein
MGPPFVALGLGGVALAVLVIIGSLAMVFSGIDRLEAMLLEQGAAPRLEVLRVAGVPQEITRKLADGEAVGDAELKNLSNRQRKLVVDAQEKLGSRRLAIVNTAERVRIKFIVIAIACAVVGVLCLPLLARRRVRQCARCGVVMS